MSHTHDLNARRQAEQPNLSRRNFLKVSAAGAGALVLTPYAAGENANAHVASQSAPPTPPDFTKVNDDWAEPWEWRPGDWPGQQLHLNVVPHAASIAVFGDAVLADVQDFLFSYNGTSPGPTIRMQGDETLYIKVRNLLGANDLDACVAPHTNGQHQQHTTNLHTHGLHVQPGRNRDGSLADDVLARIIPMGDYAIRQKAQSPDCWPLGSDEVVAEADFEFRLSEIGETHPPGTFWYHPHPHGATFDQVASGMAGFLIVEGDVDQALTDQIPGLRERLILVQRVIGPKPSDAEGFSKDGVKIPNSPAAFPVVNGQSDAHTLVMQPGAVERWRVLNGSVDGQGYFTFMLVEGYCPDQTSLDAAVTNADLHQTLHHLAMDGITLVTNDPNNPQYTTRPVTSLVMVPANRADFLFQAPHLDEPYIPQIFTVVAAYYADANDETPFQGKAPAAHLAIATLVVRTAKDDKGNDLPPLPAIDLNTLRFPPVPEMLYPVTDQELTIPPAEATARGKAEEADLLRTRQLLYSGWGQPPKQDAGQPVDRHGATGDTMQIDGQKFDAATVSHKMVLNTAEEWTVWNCSLTIWDQDHRKSSGAKITTKAVDHPFHIHINPCWVTQIVDAAGNNLLDEPRWQDAIRLPRNGGHVVFRARFWDYTGRYVNHCHILTHEDHGMMQTVEVVVDPKFANYVAQKPGYTWPQPSRDDCYQINLSGGSGDTHQ